MNADDLYRKSENELTKEQLKQREADIKYFHSHRDANKDGYLDTVIYCFGCLNIKKKYSGCYTVPLQGSILAFFQTRQPGKDVRKDTCPDKILLAHSKLVIINILSKTES